ncbi:hypothetical protein [Sulfurimonas sp. C5]|uniref:hypothetical protein n=1 Tax=Sulfurimonas sp. C5 TaxID=3036947 RepID=UPI002458914F|nr:hypothetical protein [Sulfurimonas sp. C5]MDH4944032.1 hypothetical protein [Sulfurimonas sp. C5]
MIKILFLFLLPLTLFGSKILSYNIYERTDRADVMITFDTPYTGTIKQSKGKSKTILKLEDASIESSKIKKVNSKYLKSLTITPLLDYTQIVAITPSYVKLIASKTSDGYGLRLRFTEEAAIKSSTATAATQTASPNLSALPTKKSDDLSTSYYIVIAILIIGILILFYLKNKIQAKQQPKAKQAPSSWLFKQDEQQQQPQQTPSVSSSFQNEISIRFQKSLDQNNSVVMLDFLNQSYLVLIGNGNILLDKFIDNQPSTQEEFETILRNRHAELEEFLANPMQPQHTHSPLDGPLQSYKERAASLAYGE